MEKVSIIIPTYNSVQTLSACLESIIQQDYENIEVIVVDNKSTDSTKQVAKKYTSFVYDKGPERTFQKNHGIKKSTGKYICFIDSDMTLTPGVISACIRKIDEDMEIGGVCIPEKSVGDGFFVKVRDFERSFYHGTEVESARFFRKENVVQVGGFEEDLIFFEESLLPQKIESLLNKKCKSRILNHIDHNEGDIQLGRWLQKKFYYGKSLQKYKEKVSEIGIQETASGQVGIMQRYIIFLGSKRFYQKPILGVGVLVLKTLEFGAGALGYISSNVTKKT